VLDLCARETYELPLNAGFVLELKTSLKILNYIIKTLARLKNYLIFAV
jgi:hypothetical protein